MQNNRVSPASAPLHEEARRHRVRLLTLLASICRKVERLQSSAAARQACRQVATRLQELRTREVRAKAGREE